MSVDIWKLIHRHSGDTDEFQFDEEEHSTLDVTDSTVEFTQTQATEIVGGSTLGTLFGQVKAWINKFVHDIANKQDKLTAGDNISITDNVISANVPAPVSNYAQLNNKPQINGNTLIGNKASNELGLQEKLVAGDNINITGNVISSTAHGGTDNYADLTHKPKINNVELSGNKTTSDLHLNQVVEVTSAEYEAMETGGTLDPNIAYFINDADPDPIIPEGGSEGEYLESDGNGGLQWGDPTANLGSAAYKNSTDRLTPDSTDIPESRAVYNAIASTISGIFTPKGNINFADLTSALLIPANIGNVYETNDAGTADSNWVQPAGTTIPAQSAVAIISADTIRFNYNGPAVFNLNDYQKKDLTATTQGANTVEGALTNLASQKAEQSALNTTNNNVSTIESKIPSSASSSNQLVTATDLVNVDKAAYWGERFTGSGASTTPYTKSFTIQRAGYYYIYGNQNPYGAGAEQTISFNLNGSRIIRNASKDAAGYFTSLHCSTLFGLHVGDVITFNSLGATGDSSYNVWGLFRVGGL